MATEHCPRCGWDRLSGFRYCRRCGYDFGQAAAGKLPDVSPAERQAWNAAAGSDGEPEGDTSADRAEWWPVIAILVVIAAAGAAFLAAYLVTALLGQVQL